MEKIDQLKLIYEATLKEIDRYRDWPIRILAFESILFLAMLKVTIVDQIALSEVAKWLASVIVVIITAWTICYFYKCHMNYLKARSVQAKIQRYLELDQLKVADKEVIPKEWFDDCRTCLFQGFWGWGFYAFFSISIGVLTVLALWGVLTKK